MGSSQCQQDVSRLFEEAVVAYLQSVVGDSPGICSTERELLAEIKAGKRPHGPTPDILFVTPVRINGTLVSWMDAKQYYASAMFVHNKKLPNATIASVRHF